MPHIQKLDQSWTLFRRTSPLQTVQMSCSKHKTILGLGPKSHPISPKPETSIVHRILVEGVDPAVFIVVRWIAIHHSSIGIHIEFEPEMLQQRFINWASSILQYDQQPGTAQSTRSATHQHLLDTGQDTLSLSVQSKEWTKPEDEARGVVVAEEHLDAFASRPSILGKLHQCQGVHALAPSLAGLWYVHIDQKPPSNA